MLLHHFMFRRQPPRILAWDSTIWKHCTGKVSQAIREKMQSEVAQNSKKNPHKSRCSFLRSQIHRVFRRRQNNLHSRIPEKQTDTRDNSNPEISTLQSRLGDSGIHLPTSQMEEPPPLYCKTAPQTRGCTGSCSTEFDSNQRVPIQSFSNESHYQTKTCLELPSSKSKRCRIEHQRAKRKLSLDKNPNSKLHSQYCLSSNAPVCIQYCELVQTPMFTKTISIQDAADYSPGFDIHTSKINQNWRQKHTQTPCRAPISKFVPASDRKDQKYENMKDLSEHIKFISSTQHQNTVFSRIF